MDVDLHAPGMAFLVVAFVLYAGFLALLGALSIGIARGLAAGGNNPLRGLAGGLLAVMATLFLGGLGILGFVVFAAGTAVGTAVGFNPIESIELDRDPAGVLEGRDDTARLTLEVEDGDAGREVVCALEALALEERLPLRIEERPRGDGGGSTLEVTLWVDEDDLDALERDLQRELKGIELPRRAKIRFR